ncbi:hypothetical protein EX30DRAFT_39233 [Ascodesmis nigricans]|uniref:Uncharacterized protein n=1 Tax=Ascodesmis nigricans TaxID=341454 RepID=A0A4S2MVY2_9PEZI|nr:hypothetical protein EX30DRAFT_39233 [Ascodesmis nigricans]
MLRSMLNGRPDWSWDAATPNQLSGTLFLLHPAGSRVAEGFGLPSDIMALVADNGLCSPYKVMKMVLWFPLPPNSLIVKFKEFRSHDIRLCIHTIPGAIQV